MYTIKMIKLHNLVSVTLDGMMSLSEVTDHISELKCQFIVHRLRDYVMAIDVSDRHCQTNVADLDSAPWL